MQVLYAQGITEERCCSQVSMCGVERIDDVGFDSSA